MKDKEGLKKGAVYAVFAVSAAAVLLLTFFCTVHFRYGFIAEHAPVILSVATGLELVYAALTLTFLLRKKETAGKLMLTGLVLAAFLLAVLFVLQATGIMDRLDSVDELREMIGKTGVWAPLIYILFQFLQVVVLPIPGTLTVGAGVLMFGPLKTSLYSLVGIFLGSLAAFWIGRSLGYRAAAWLVGKDTLDKWMCKIKGKDKVVLGAMFLLPVFPDDVLCFVAGLSTMSWRFFIVLQLISRSISVFATSYSLNGSIIPFTTWWGILCWCLIAAAVAALFWFLFRKGDKIEKWFCTVFCRKKMGTAEARGAKAQTDAQEKTEGNGGAAAQGKTEQNGGEP